MLQKFTCFTRALSQLLTGLGNCHDNTNYYRPACATKVAGPVAKAKAKETTEVSARERARAKVAALHSVDRHLHRSAKQALPLGYRRVAWPGNVAFQYTCSVFLSRLVLYSCSVFLVSSWLG